MTPNGTVTLWMVQAREGDVTAIQALWERYFPPLVNLVRGKLRNAPRSGADEEDLALSAFDSFYRRAAAGGFPQLADRHDLWSVLVMVASRKVYDHVEHEHRAGRDDRRVERGDDAGTPEASPLTRLISREPDPALAAEVADSCRRLLAVLPDDEMRAIAVMKLEGHTNQEIAGRIGKALASVERRLDLIRQCWRENGVG